VAHVSMCDSLGMDYCRREDGDDRIDDDEEDEEQL